MQTVEYYSPRFGNWTESSGGKKWRYVAAATIAVVFIAPVVIPVAVVAALIWGKRAFTAPMAMMSGGSTNSVRDEMRTRWRDQRGQMRHGWGWGCGGGKDPRGRWQDQRSSGNEAFDAYRADTLKRLEDEQEQFEGFLARLRQAKDKAEFDAFMDEQVKRRDDDAGKPDIGLDDDSPVEAKK
jgi:Protein of unknown function (DUF2852)